MKGVESTVSDGTTRFTIGAAAIPLLREAARRLRGAEQQAASARSAEAAQAAASRERQAAAAEPGMISAERLRSLVERIERLEEERKTLGSDIKDIFGQAKSAGFDEKVLRQLIRLRKQDPADVELHEALLDTYRRALGM